MHIMSVPNSPPLTVEVLRDELDALKTSLILSLVEPQQQRQAPPPRRLSIVAESRASRRASSVARRISRAPGADMQPEYGTPRKTAARNGICSPMPTVTGKLGCFAAHFCCRRTATVVVDPRGEYEPVPALPDSGRGEQVAGQQGIIDASRMKDSSSKRQSLAVTVRNIVLGSSFTKLSCAVLALNVFNISLAADQQARNQSLLPTHICLSINLACTVYYAIELLLRLLAFGIDFFRWMNNNIDTLLFIVQVLELHDDWMLVSVRNPHMMETGCENLQFWRLVLLYRVTRFVRCLRLFDDLNELLDSVISSLTSLVWTMVLISITTLGFGLFLLRIVTWHRIEMRYSNEETDEKLFFHYGSLDRVMISLYEAVAGGISWCELVDPLRTSISPYMSAVFIIYIYFVSFVMLNVVTALLVDATVRCNEINRDQHMCSQIFQAFKLPDGSLPSSISREEFEGQYQSPKMAAFFSSLDLSPEEALDHHLFELFDIDGGGSVDVNELVKGCLRLKGTTKQVDFAAFVREYREDVERLLLLNGRSTL